MTTAASSTIEVPGVTDRENLRVRGFGDRSELLDVDFGQSVRPRLVTGILDRFIGGHATSADMPPSWRIAALLGLWRQVGGVDLEFRVTCPSCEGELELMFPLTDLLADVGSWELPPSVTVGPDDIELRLPTGSDLERWAISGDGPLVSDLGVAGRVLREEVEEALTEADPLVDFSLEAECPDCRQGLSVPVDLEIEALFALEAVRADQIREIHRLALAYSWTEKQVLAIPAERRREYLRLLDGGEHR